MNNTFERHASLWSRLAVIPAVIGLVGTSVVFGYASSAFSPKNRHEPIRIVRNSPAAEPVADRTTGIAPETPTDPVADYKATLALLKQNYYGDPVDAKKSEQLTYDAIRGMLGSLKDQFTSFLDPDDWTQMQATTRGNFEGIGAMLQQDGQEIKVVEPIETSPAEKAGVKTDDVIVKVDDKPILGKNINDVVKLIKGPSGTKVTLSVVRGKEHVDIPIIRASVEPPVVKYWMEDKDAKIGRIQLKEFNEKSMEQLTKAFDDLKAQGMKGLILDLRGNPGGLLEVAIQVASIFVPRDENPSLNNTVVFIHEGSGQERARQLRSDDYMLDGLPLAVLVNENTASASEITSGAIKDYGVGTLIGERTFGKGKVQTLFPLDDGKAGALRLTTAFYYPPKHYDINFKHDDDGNRIPDTGGILPDITVKQPDEWKGFKDLDHDTQLKKGLAFMRDRLKGMTTAQAVTDVNKKP